MGELTFRHCEAREWNEYNEAIHESHSTPSLRDSANAESKQSILSNRESSANRLPLANLNVIIYRFAYQSLILFFF